MANSTDNRKAMAAWSRQPEINTLIAERDKLQKQLDKVLAGAFSEAAEKQADGLYNQIAALNKRIGTKQSKAKRKPE